MRVITQMLATLALSTLPLSTSALGTSACDEKCLGYCTYYYPSDECVSSCACHDYTIAHRSTYP